VTAVVNTKKDLIPQGIHISVVHMKLRVILIIGLLALGLIAPALADRVDFMDVTYSEDQKGNPRPLSVHLTKAVESNTSDIFPPAKFPTEKYKFISLYYSLYNPSNKSVYYEFNVSLRDQANRHFYSDVALDTVPAGQHYDRVLYFAVYRNSTNLQLVWTDKEVNPPWFHYDTVLDIDFKEVTPTPTATATATPTATPTPTPAPTGGCLAFLPLGLIIGSVGCVGLLTKKYGRGR
jgi:hypothetical protein